MVLKRDMAFRGQCIGLMGGSFNPPHKGHSHLAHLALSRLGLNAVWWLVSPQNPLKNPRISLPYEHRLAAVKALAHPYRMRVSDLECRLKTVHTYDIVRQLQIRYPGVHFVWIMGSDSLFGFHRWQNWQALARHIPMAVIARPGLLRPPGYALRARLSLFARLFTHHRLPAFQASSLAHQKPPAWLYLTAPLNTLSSSGLRIQKAATKEALDV